MTYRAGVIGVGGVGRGHGSAYLATEGIDVVAIADVDEGFLDELGGEWDVPAGSRYLDHVEMLESEELDVVSVATPTFYHAEGVVDAAEAGNPEVVFCEKPIATSVSDAEAMVDACDGAGVDLVVNHTRRWADPWVALHDRLNVDGLVGDVRSANAQFKLELLRNGTHFADTLYWLLGERAVRASGHFTGETPMRDRDLPIPVDDGAGGGHLVLADDTFLTLDCVVPREAFSGWITFTGSEGRLYVNEGDREARYWRFEDGAHVEEPVEVFSPDWGGWAGAFENAVANLVELADGDGMNRSPGREATHVLEMLVALFVSAHTASEVGLPLDRPLRDVSVSSW